MREILNRNVYLGGIYVEIIVVTLQMDEIVKGDTNCTRSSAELMNVSLALTIPTPMLATAN